MAYKRLNFIKIETEDIKATLTYYQNQDDELFEFVDNLRNVQDFLLSGRPLEELAKQYHTKVKDKIGSTKNGLFTCGGWQVGNLEVDSDYFGKVTKEDITLYKCKISDMWLPYDDPSFSKEPTVYENIAKFEQDPRKRLMYDTVTFTRSNFDIFFNDAYKQYLNHIVQWHVISGDKEMSVSIPRNKNKGSN